MTRRCSLAGQQLWQVGSSFRWCGRKGLVAWLELLLQGEDDLGARLPYWGRHIMGL